MASASYYAVLSGSEIIESVTNDVGDPLTNLGESPLSSGLFAPEGLPGVRRAILFMGGFTDVQPEDITANVRIKLPRPIEIDAAGTASPPFNQATPVFLISPANEQHASWYDTAQPVAYASFAPDATSPPHGDLLGSPPAPGTVSQYWICTVEMRALPIPAEPVQLMLSIDFPHSFTR